MSSRHTCPPCHQVSTVLWSFASSRGTYHPTYSLKANLLLIVQLCTLALTSCTSTVHGTMEFLHGSILKCISPSYTVFPCSPSTATKGNLLSSAPNNCQSRFHNFQYVLQLVAVLHMVGHFSWWHSNFASSQSSMSASCTNCRIPTHKYIVTLSMYCNQPHPR